MPWAGNYEDLVDYLRHFVNFGGGPNDYDFIGVVHLMLASLDNLNRNALEAHMEDIAEVLDKEQAAFVLRLADHLRKRDPA